MPKYYLIAFLVLLPFSTLFSQSDVTNLTQQLGYNDLQVAINDANDNDYIQVFPGTYNTGYFITNKNGLVIESLGATINASGSAGFTFDTSRNCIVKNFIISNGPNGIRLRNSSSSNLVEGNTIVSASNSGIVINTLNCDFNIIRSNIINGASDTDYGIKLITTGISNYFENNEIYNCFISGIQIDGTGTNFFRDNYIHNNTQYGINLDNNSDKNYISGNSIQDNPINGIRISSSQSEFQSIISNEIVNNGGDALLLKGEYHKIYYNLIINSGEDGLDLDSSTDNCEVINNTFFKSAGNGFRFKDSSGTIAYNNIFLSNNAYGLNKNGGGAAIVSDYNVYWGNNLGAVISMVEGTNSRYEDPLLNIAGNYEIITMESPAFDWGTNIAGVNDNYIGRYPDIGWRESPFIQGGPFYVDDDTGNDRHSGIFKYPLRTIQKASVIMSPGVTNANCYVFPGTYNEAFTITANANSGYMNFSNLSNELPTIDFGANFYGIQIFDADRILISGFNMKKASWAGIALNGNAQNCIIRNNNIYSNTEIGVYLVTAANISNQIIKNQMYGPIQRRGMFVGNAIYTEIHSNTFINHDENGIELSNSRDGIIKFNDFQNSVYSGIFINGADNYTIYSNRCFGSPQKTGIYIVSEATNNIIIKNSIYSNSDQGIYFNSDIADNNYILTNNIWGTNHDNGILITDADNNVISANLITGSCSNGIAITGSAQGNKIINSTISSKSKGITLYDPSYNNFICSNRIYNNSNVGVCIYSASNTISFNNIYSNIYGGIVLQGSAAHHNNMVSNNTWGLNQDFGIYLNGSDNNLISGNICNGNESAGIYLRIGAVGNIVTHNTICSNNVNGIRLNQVTNNWIGTNNIYGPNQERGIHIVWSSANNTICYNRIHHITNYGIQTEGPSISNEFRNNNIYSNNDHGIFFAGTTIFNRVINNDIWGYNQMSGIRLNTADNVLILSNRIYYNNQYGIHGYNNADGTEIFHNAIYSNNTAGIYLDGCVSNLIASNNITGGMQDIGIHIKAGTNHSIFSNRIYDNLKSGIQIEYISQLTKIYRNSISGNNTNGIYIYNPVNDNHSIYSNHISGPDQDNGVNIWYSANNKIYRNLIEKNDKLGIRFTGLAAFCTNNLIANNVIYKNNEEGGIAYYNNANGSVYNNIIISNGNSAASPGIYNDSTGTVNVDYNVFYRNAGGPTNGTLVWGTHNFVTNPMINMTSFTIESYLNPCLDSGTIIAGISDSYKGKKPDIGLHETGITYPGPFYVSTNGTAGNLGTWFSPFLTIQEAANEMMPGVSYPTCFILPGKYVGGITINSNKNTGYMVFKNYSSGTPVIDGGGGADYFDIINADNIELSGLKIKNFSMQGVYVRGSSKSIKIKNNIITSNTGCGINIYTSANDYCEISGNTIYGPGQNIGISIDASISNIVLSNIIFNHPNNGIQLAGVAESVKWNDVSHNIVSGNASGIYVRRGENNLVYSNRVNNNNYGILLGPFVNRNNTINYNNVYSNNSGGIFFNGAGSIYSNNILYNTSWGSIQDQGILLLNSDNNKILGNIVHNNQYAGIKLDGSAVNNIITDNIAFDNMHGIYLDELGVQNNKVFYNDIYGPDQTNGIHIFRASHNLVYSNKIHHQINAGVLITGSYASNNVISNNNIFSNELSGVSIDYEWTDGNYVIGNNIWGRNQDKGIYIQDADYNYINGNNVHDNIDGIYVFSTNIAETAISNYVYNNYISDNLNHGIYNRTESGNGAVYRTNRVWNCGTGIKIDEMDNDGIYRNVVFNCSTNFYINMDNCDNIKFINNTSANASDSGIYINGTGTIEVINNGILDNSIGINNPGSTVELKWNCFYGNTADTIGAGTYNSSANVFGQAHRLSSANFYYISNDNSALLDSGTNYFSTDLVYGLGPDIGWNESSILLPAPPSGLEGFPVTDTRIDLFWVVNNHDSGDYYIIQRSTNNIDFYKVNQVAAASTLNYSDTVIPNREYYYRVIGTNIYGYSPTPSKITNIISYAQAPDITYEFDPNDFYTNRTLHFTNKITEYSNGGAAYYKYAWTTNKVYNITTSDSNWYIIDTNVLTISDIPNGVYYLYVKSYNMNNAGFHQTNIGPYNIFPEIPADFTMTNNINVANPDGNQTIDITTSLIKSYFNTNSAIMPGLEFDIIVISGSADINVIDVNSNRSGIQITNESGIITFSIDSQKANNATIRLMSVLRPVAYADVEIGFFNQPEHDTLSLYNNVVNPYKGYPIQLLINNETPNEQISVLIYNTYGQKMYDFGSKYFRQGWVDILNSWDGRINGQYLPTGVYYLVIQRPSWDKFKYRKLFIIK